MEATLPVHYNGTAVKFKIISSLYLEEPAWIVRPDSGEELIIVKKKGCWQQPDGNEYDKHLVKAIGEAIDLARESGKEPFATVDSTTPPPPDLF